MCLYPGCVQLRCRRNKGKVYFGLLLAEVEGGRPATKELEGAGGASPGTHGPAIQEEPQPVGGGGGVGGRQWMQRTFCKVLCLTDDVVVSS